MLIKKNAHVIVRGLRDANDFLYEFPRAMLIKNMAPDIENIFLTTDNKYYHVSSSAIRELAQFGGNITHLVPHCVELAIHEKNQTSTYIKIIINYRGKYHYGFIRLPSRIRRSCG